MDLKNEISNLNRMALDYSEMLKIGDFMSSPVNSGEYIDLYIEWFLQSRELFSDFFKENETAYKEFCTFDTIGNGYVLSSKFSRTYPLFKILIKKIKNSNYSKLSSNLSSKMKNKIFIVHGHNNELKLEVARFIETDFNKEAVILHERPNKGREILGKFEDEADVDIAIAIWSQDDLGKLKKSKMRN